MKLWNKIVLWDSRRFRLQAADENGVAQCATHPGNYFDKINYLQLGHYFIRQHKSVYFDEVNRALQCGFCNSAMNNPNLKIHQVIKTNFKNHIIKTYGHSELARIEATYHQVKKFTQGELNEILIEMKLDCKRLLKEKGIEKWW